MTLAVTSACLRRLMVVSSLAADSVALSQAERIAMSVAACAPEALSSAAANTSLFRQVSASRAPMAAGLGRYKMLSGFAVSCASGSGRICRSVGSCESMLR